MCVCICTRGKIILCFLGLKGNNEGQLDLWTKLRASDRKQISSVNTSHFTAWFRAATPHAFGLPGAGESRDGMWERLHLSQYDTSRSRKAGSCLELCMEGDEEAERGWGSLA